MKLQSGFNRCVICLSEIKLTYEHMIPESLGGFVEVNLQCAKCNNDSLGSKLISKAKKIYPIRLAIRSLKSELPKLFKSIEEGQLYTAKSSDESIIPAFFKNGKIITKAKKVSDNMINIDIRDVEENLRRLLKKEGLSENEIEEKLIKFHEQGSDEPIKLTNRHTIVKRRFLNWFPAASATNMDNRIIALMAYNYLCITTGEMIFDEYFDSVREYIKSGIISKYLQFEQFPYNGPYKPYHKIYRENKSDEIIVTIVLFGSIVYKVRFMNLRIMTDDNYIIIQELVDKKLYFAQTIQEAKKGLYYFI
ncbi:MAG: hypothetical protein HRU80_13375 [Ignavibacteriales bacterium]|nr:MAG: hypothetical protein HRU80_13375 [Ignavibacteriales bacterium]